MYTHIYIFTDRSKVSTYPRSSGKIAGAETTSDGASRDSSDYYSEYSNPDESSDREHAASGEGGSESYDDPTTPSSDRTKSSSERYSDNINAEHCKEVEKDSMTCTICKDPTTGNDFERCSYSYRPSDKLFSYTKSSSFGNPRRNGRSEKTARGSEKSDGPEIAEDSYEYIPEQTYRASTTVDEDGAGENGATTTKRSPTSNKAEIEGFLQDFRQKDRSKCKKIMRDKMTCYRCVDEEGFQKEECVFVAGQEPDRDRPAFRETKESQLDPASRARARKLRSAKAETAGPSEPDVSASKNSYAVRSGEKSDNEYPDEARQRRPAAEEEETKEAEPYDYTAETRSRYDRVLGLTLPAYMSTISEHEAAFDEVVASSYDQR